jgi:hypothetical protein
MWAPLAAPTPRLVLPSAHSQAFVKLESLPAIPEAQRAAFAEAALGVFTANAPADPATLKEATAGAGGGGRHAALLSDLEAGGRDQVGVRRRRGGVLVVLMGPHRPHTREASH